VQVLSTTRGRLFVRRCVAWFGLQLAHLLAQDLDWRIALT